MVSGPSVGSVYRLELVKAISGVSDGQEIDALWKTGKANFWSVSFVSDSAARDLVEIEAIMLINEANVAL